MRIAIARGSVALLGVLPVTALLAWVYGLGAFRTWFVATGLPAVVALLAVGAVTARGHGPKALRLGLVAGALGGLAGTIGYDVFRLPFVAAGLRLLAPIDSYGLVLLGTDASSGVTGFAGWAFHFTNGIGFGIAYGLVALGRRWPWAVLWGLVLETATIVTPFAESYALRGKWGLIAIAYAAHVAYGVPLGLIVQRAAAWDPKRPLQVPPATLLAVLVVGLALWLRPWATDADVARGKRVAPGPSAIVKGGRFHPEWIRVTGAACVALQNEDDRAYRLPAPNAPLPARGRARLCMAGTGAKRVQLERRPYSGGFVLLDRGR